MSWECKIVKAFNGYIIEFDDESGDIPTKRFVVCEDGSGECGEVDSTHSMLYELVDYFGMRGSKYDKKRIYIEVKENKDG